MNLQLLLFTILFFSCSSHHRPNLSENFTEDPHKSSLLLVDSLNNIKFILDSTRTVMTALDFNNQQIWSTDPWLDNKIPEYRIKRPTIVHVTGTQKKINHRGWDSIKDVLEISYNNSQFGVLDRKTGNYLLLGQD